MLRVYILSLLSCHCLAGTFVVASGANSEAGSGQTAKAKYQTAGADDPKAPIAKPDSRPAFHPDLLKRVKGATPLNPEQTAFLDVQKKRVLLKTRVACTDCLLEMLVCPAGTKEHEAVLAYDGKAYVVHTALLALGLKPGRPVVFSPEFKEPAGPKLNLTVHWRNKDGKLVSADARKWMSTSVSHYFSKPLAAAPKGIKFPFRELRYDKYNKEILWFGQMKADDKRALLAQCDELEYQKAIEAFYLQSQPRPMTADFVFTGSYMTRRTQEGPEFYAAEDGYLICVANFASATIDVKEVSSASDGSQAYEAKSDVVPPRHTPVILELSPAE